MEKNDLIAAIKAKINKAKEIKISETVYTDFLMLDSYIKDMYSMLKILRKTDDLLAICVRYNYTRYFKVDFPITPGKSLRDIAHENGNNIKSIISLNSFELTLWNVSGGTKNIII